MAKNRKQKLGRSNADAYQTEFAAEPNATNNNSAANKGACSTNQSNR